jgi:DNA-directed RNA polymerase specialized sigma24 family protein
MIRNSDTLPSDLFPSQPIPEGGDAFAHQAHGLLDGRPKDDATVNHALVGMDKVFEKIASDLYNLASMLVGEGEQSVRLVETAVATADVSECDEPLAARRSGRRALAKAALEMIAQSEPRSLIAPPASSGPASCIEDDDLESAGVSPDELERMMAGPDRDRVREWLSELPTGVRTIFALRAVAGFSTMETVELLSHYGGPWAGDWNPQSVGEVFRRGLCALASQLLHASTAH